MFEDFISYHEDMIEEINLKTQSRWRYLFIWCTYFFSILNFFWSIYKRLFQYWITALLRLVRDFMAQI